MSVLSSCTCEFAYICVCVFVCACTHIQVLSVNHGDNLCKQEIMQLCTQLVYCLIEHCLRAHQNPQLRAVNQSIPARKGSREENGLALMAAALGGSMWELHTELIARLKRFSRPSVQGAGPAQLCCSKYAMHGWNYLSTSAQSKRAIISSIFACMPVRKKWEFAGLPQALLEM